ncbi:MAG: hypothetical protein ACI8PT_001038 [Gammaproteobacteria bacterium]|jgi:hypothetical protein
MKRREMFAVTAAALVVPYVGGAFASTGHVDYTDEAYKAALESGKPFMLDFYASW